MRRAPGGWFWWEPFAPVATWTDDKVYKGPGPSIRCNSEEIAWDVMRKWAASQGTAPFELDQKNGGKERAEKPARDSIAFAPFSQPAPGPWAGTVAHTRWGARHITRTKPWEDIRDGYHRVVAKVATVYFDSVPTLRLIRAAPSLYRFVQGIARDPVSGLSKTAALLLQSAGLAVNKDIAWRE